MNIDIALFFDKMPEMLTVYLLFEKTILQKYPGVKKKVQKTQISFSNKHGFLYVSLPYRKVKARPEYYMIISFGLPFPIYSPRIAEVVEPYPNRWTHHVIVQIIDDINDELLDWIDQSFRFSLEK